MVILVTKEGCVVTSNSYLGYINQIILVTPYSILVSISSLAKTIKKSEVLCIFIYDIVKHEISSREDR